ncbi:ABC transporter permease [Cellulomonas fimi]|uniref:ABC transporter permease n=1 Tax=Cellulomonas fimi (strain ATCC 484 / DSM 20113 / JCM 1341 / CCUG 24087 / LMG 16345 / NBRC 15513 / NCIMB 8980 / NCTC 7547 / NRS-133) TaxID=590998 RepID=F4H1V5_CELFA|nr:ABC transporter permease subunit [Cellulomonas fimi]AEE47525.1 hypothetical protein Celf_3413 [Cellulomonas fimi ATCC 484]NNH05497.1 ABC transporter permease subunit [Cellulomonas fimi]VEH36465.1 ABC-type transport system involved in multi-copper enzyme maturation, permease component [Cellulomonas fimi]
MNVTHVELDDSPAAPPAAPRSATWGLTWHGVRTVAALELRQRVRSTRWIVALVVWFLVVGAMTLLITGALGMADDEGLRRGSLVFAGVTFLVLGLGLLVTPTLTSTSVNGDRNAGTLATLQVTLLTPAEIAAGKLLAAWASACAFLVVSLPFLVLALLLGDTPPTSTLAALVVIALLLASVCGVGLGWSSLVARTAGSTVLTFVTVAALTVFTPLLFALTFPLVSGHEQVQVYGPPEDWYTDAQQVEAEPECDVTVQERYVTHTERTWWLLAANPFVVVADAAGTSRHVDVDEPLGALREGVRGLRQGPPPIQDECWWSDVVVSEQESAVVPLEETDSPASTPVWPFGLGLHLLLGATGFVVAVRRLRVPQHTLARGTRVA